MKKYLIVTSGEDGISHSWYTEETIDKRLNEDLDDLEENQHWVSQEELDKNPDLEEWDGENFLLMEVKVIVPKKVETITKMSIE